jgi:hypothetical protein
MPTNKNTKKVMRNCISEKHYTIGHTEIKVIPISQPISPEPSIYPPSIGGDIKAYPRSITELIPHVVDGGERADHDTPWFAI